MPPAGLPRANIDRGGGRPRAPGPALCSELTVKSRPGHTGLGQRCPGGSVPAHARVRPHGERHRGLGKPLHPAPHPAVVSLLVSGIIPAQGQGAGQDAQGVMEKDKRIRTACSRSPQPPHTAQIHHGAHGGLQLPPPHPAPTQTSLQGLSELSPSTSKEPRAPQSSSGGCEPH